MKKYLGIDLGGSYYKYGLYSHSGEDLQKSGKINLISQIFNYHNV